MIPLKQVIDEINAVYILETDVAALGSAMVRLDGVLDNPALNATNRENAEALYDRLAAKFELIKFVVSPSQDMRAKLRDDLALLKADAEKKGFAKTKIMLDEVDKIFSRIEADIADVLTFEKQLKNNAQNDPDVLRLTSEAIRAAVPKVEAEQFPSSFTGGAVMLDARVEILNFLGVIKKRVDSELRAALSAKLKDCLEDITSKYTLYEFYPAAEHDEGGKANTVILSSPFIEDVKLYASNNRKDTKNKIYLVSSGKLHSEILDMLFDYLKNEGADIIVSDLASEELDLQKDVLKRCIAYGKEGASVVVNDSIGDGTLYSTALKVATENGFSALDVYSEFLSVPPFNAVFDELVDREMLKREDIAILKNMPFLGFMGLNQIVKAYALKNANWMDQGKRLSERNRDRAISFLRHIKAPYMFIDSGWGDYSEFEKHSDDHYEFDYDSIRNVNVENIRRIVESNSPVFAKCGMAARYCTIAGDDESVWKSLSKEEMELRLITATKVVFKLLRIDIDPEVKLLEKLGNSTAGGLCVGGGKEIQYLLRCVQNDLDWTWGAIVHESFHAMQHQLTHGGWKRWYFDEFGITQGRVEKWSDAIKVYDNNTKSDLYRVHIYECDAYAFEIDCKLGRNYYWGGLELT